MILQVRILITILFTIVASIVLFIIPNYSNFSSFIMIPLIVSLLTKYIVGDWDKGYKYTISDIFYWLSIIGTSYGVVYILSNYTVFKRVTI